MNFVLLNPSTADETTNDHTIRRCINLSKSWGYDGFYVTNLFAFRNRHPKFLKESSETIGNKNDLYIKEFAMKSKIVVVAWGTHGNYLQRDREVLENLRMICSPYCIELTKEGFPKHPLTVKKDSILQKFI